MQLVYLTEPGSYLSKDGNTLVVKKDRDSVIKTIGLEHVEGVILLGCCNLSSGLALELLERQIPVTWLSQTGAYFGRLEATTGYDIERQLDQFDAFRDEEFRMALSRKWINGKLENQRGLLRRLNRRRELKEVDEICNRLEDAAEGVKEARTRDEVMGYEGNASKYYFQGLSIFTNPDFQFEGRSKRPPRDRFNSLLSFGYTLLLYEVFTAISAKNLHPYLGFLHQPRRGHPALASDMMEEWRPVIIDSLIMGIVTGNQIKKTDFDPPDENGGVYLRRDASKSFIEKYEKRLRSVNQYLSYVDYPLSFRESLAFQVGTLAKAVELKDPDCYRPVYVR